MTWFNGFTKTLSIFLNGLFTNIGMGETAEPWVKNFRTLFDNLFNNIMATIAEFN